MKSQDIASNTLRHTAPEYKALLAPVSGCIYLALISSDIIISVLHKYYLVFDNLAQHLLVR